MMALLIYYNPQKNSFYIKQVHSLIFDKKVGDINQFNHVLIQVFFINGNKFISCEDFWDYHRKTKETSTKKNKKTVISSIKNFLHKKKMKGARPWKQKH